MVLSSLSVMLLLTVLLHCGQAEVPRPKPTLRVEPQSTVYTGDTVTLICEMQTALTGSLNFHWFKGPPSVKLKDVVGDRVNVTASNTGTEEYQCVAKDGQDYVSDYSDSVKITVRDGVRPKAKVRVQPAERVSIGDRVTLTCDVESGDVWNYEWFKDNKPLSDAQRKKEYEISAVDESHTGVYSCRGTQSTQPLYSETSDAVTLILVVKPKPTARVEPQSTVYTGDTVTLICELQRPLTGSWKFLWFKGTPLVKLKDPDGDRVSVTVSNTGTEEYQCVALIRQYYHSEYSDPVKITVRVRPKAKVRVQPAERVSIGDRVTLTCDVESGDVWNYEWFKDNKPLSDAQRKKEYEISAVDESHTGVYSCRGTQSTQPRYSETSDAVTLTVESGLSRAAVGLAVGLGLSFFLCMTLVLICCYKKRKGAGSVLSSNENQQNMDQSVSGPANSLSESAADAPQTKADDVIYSQINHSQEDDAVPGPSGALYAQINKKKANGKGKATADADIVYSKLKYSAP